MGNHVINSNDIKLKFLKDTYSVCLKHVSLVVPIISIYAFILFIITHEVETASISDALNLSGLILVITAFIMIVFIVLVVTLGILFVNEDTNGNFEKKMPRNSCFVI